MPWNGIIQQLEHVNTLTHRHYKYISIHTKHNRIPEDGGLSKELYLGDKRYTADMAPV